MSPHDAPSLTVAKNGIDFCNNRIRQLSHSYTIRRDGILRDCSGEKAEALLANLDGEYKAALKPFIEMIDLLGNK